MPHAGPTYEDFAPHVGSDFTLSDNEETGPIQFTLISAKPLGNKPGFGDFRAPFQLDFRVASQDVYQQGLYRLTHPVMGTHDIFLVPAARTDNGVDYCATFN